MMRLTDEQQHAVELFGSRQSLAVEAGAGTGKTSTLRALAESTRRRGQYLAFGRAIVEESASKFPRTVSCRTAHSLAMAAVGRRFAHRLKEPRRPTRLVAIDLDITDPIAIGGHRLGYTRLTSYVLNALDNFCKTADPEPAEKHFEYINGIDAPDKDGKRTYANNDRLRRYMLPYLQKAWADVCNPRGCLPYKHDYYLKLWERSNPRVNADYFLIDEAQDLNPTLDSIIRQQTWAQHVFVGDSAQAIYGFTGAVNALAQVDVPHRAQLTQSFRFGPEIAEQANFVLAMLGSPMRLRGLPSIVSTVGYTERPDAYLGRTNATCVEHLIYCQQMGLRAHLVGGGADTLAFAIAADELQRKGFTGHHDLACFKTWLDVLDYVDHDRQGQDLKLRVNLVDRFGADKIIDAIGGSIPAERADVTICTAHKAKGLQWDSVALLPDYPAVGDMDEEDLRLLYVALTRPRCRLDWTAVRLEPEDSVDMATS